MDIDATLNLPVIAAGAYNAPTNAPWEIQAMETDTDTPASPVDQPATPRPSRTPLGASQPQ